MNEQKSPHILNASSNLLGLCFVVLTSLKIMKLKIASILNLKWSPLQTFL